MPAPLNSYVEITYDGKPIFISGIKKCDSKTFLDKKVEADENLKLLLLHYQVQIDKLNKKVDELSAELKAIKGEE